MGGKARTKLRPQFFGDVCRKDASSRCPKTERPCCRTFAMRIVHVDLPDGWAEAVHD